jgi:N-methylhydantoinase A
LVWVVTGYRLGVDIGGTFTDIVVLAPDGTVFSKKVLSTPDDYSRAIESGVAELLEETGIAAGELGEFAHGTTVATNAVIERRGGKVALVTTRGFRDVLELGRFRSPRLYDLGFRKPDPLVERRLRFEVDERTSGRGELLVPVDPAVLDRLADRMRAEGVQAVAVCFLNSYVNPDNELAAKRRLEARLGDVPVSASAQLLPQIQEYERTSTTVINAYIRPVVERYVRALAKRMRRIGVKVPLTIMQSSGGLLPAELAAANPVYIIESGPAAGVVGAQRLGALLGYDDVMVFDMGGTTAKASLVEDGRFAINAEAEVGRDDVGGHRLLQGGGYPVQVPTIDIVEVGAGGGSIAAVDVAGGFRVGPRSAGAVPGPACYGRGGDLPTVTDANLLLGYVNPTAMVGGDLVLDRAKAEAALAGLGIRLGRSTTDAAYGIHLIANANMMRALSSISTERGRDPSRFAIVAVGGNGGVHAGGLAESLGIRRILVPPAAGLFSALGLLFADVEHDFVRAFYRRLADTAPACFNAAAAPFVEEAHRLLEAEGFTDAAQRAVEVQASMKYVGQTWTLPIACRAFPADSTHLAAMAEAFGESHGRHYGYRSDGEPLQFVALRVVGRGRSALPRVPDRIRRAKEWIAARGERNAYFGPDIGWLAVPVLPRADLGTAARDGPLIVDEYDTSIVVRPGWRARLDGWNTVVVERA